MENTKAKKLIISVLVVLLLACLGVVVWQYIRLNISNNVVVQEGAANNNTQLEQGQVTDKTENDQENKIDPYANYKDITWSTKSVTQSSVKAEIKIKDGKVYVSEDLDYDGEYDKAVEIKGINGTPIKVTLRNIGGMFDYVILTKEGRVYSIMYGNTNVAPKLTDLTKYNVIDMTAGQIQGVGGEVYFLTSDGKLLNFEGKESKYEFVKQVVQE